MVQRLIRLPAAVVLAGLAWLFAYPSAPEAARKGTEPVQARIAEVPNSGRATSQQGPATVSATKKGHKHLHSRKRQSKRFVRLSRRILDNTLICRDEFEFTGTLLDSRLNGCLAIDHDLKWAFAADEEPPVQFTEHPFTEPLGELIGSRQMMTQPLQVYWVGSALILKPLFTPLTKNLSLGVEAFNPGSEVWLLEQDWTHKSKGDTAFDHLFTGDTGLESAPVGYRYHMDQHSAFVAGVGYIYDISDTTGMSQAFAQAGYETPEKVGAVNLTLGYSYNDFTLTGGYIHAIEDRDSLSAIAANDEDNGPTAWSSQLAYNTRLLNRPMVFAFGYQKSSEALGHYLPEERYTTKASILLRETTTLSLEYYQDKEYSGVDSLDAGDAYGITTRLGLQF